MKQVDVEMLGQKALTVERSYLQNKDQKLGFLSAMYLVVNFNFLHKWQATHVQLQAHP